MELLYYFVFGLVVAALGTIPPGLLNMTAAKISLREGDKNASYFSLGVVAVVILQVWISLLFARFLERNPEVIAMLQLVGLGVFICLTIYFLFLAKDTRKFPKRKKFQSHQSRFYQGMFFSGINLFPFPYWVFMSITFSSFGWFEIEKHFILFCTLGAAVGTYFLLRMYVVSIHRWLKLASLNMNYIIGVITGIISVVALIKIINENF